VLKSLQPIYAGEPRVPGNLYGNAIGDVRELLAKPGYAVGAVICKAAGAVDGLRVVFFREGDNDLDPSERYESDWVGGRGGYEEVTLGGSGQPIVGVYGTAGGELNSLGLMIRSNNRQLPRSPTGAVALARARPLATTVGWSVFVARRPEDALWTFSDSQPFLPERLEYCNEFLFAHAPSRIVYTIPPEARSFSAVGYCVQSCDVKFRVAIDGQVKYESPRAGMVPIAIDIPPGAKTLELVVDDLGNNSSDWSHWLMPRLHFCPAAQIGKDETGSAVKLIERRPLEVKVGSDVLRINDTLGPMLLPRFDVVQPCNEFLFAHAPSHLTYAVPPGATEFSAIGYNVHSLTVKFRVFVDGQGAYESPLAGIVPIRVPLPPGARRLDLIVDDFDGNSLDASFWCYPRFSSPGSFPGHTAGGEKQSGGDVAVRDK
jgi:hypothetical protein